MTPTAPPIITIETDRLLLKEVTPEFHDYIFANWADEEIMAYLGFFEMANFMVEKEKNKRRLVNYNVSFKLFIMQHKASGNVIGKIGFHTWNAHHNRSEMGYNMVREDYKNQGYTTEAMKPILIHGFEQMNLNRIDAMIAPWNTPSVKLVQRFGFTHEGTMRGHYLRDGLYEDSACYSLLRSEYDTLKHNW